MLQTENGVGKSETFPQLDFDHALTLLELTYINLIKTDIHFPK